MQRDRASVEWPRSEGGDPTEGSVGANLCEEEAEITLSCGHKKLTTCSKARHGQHGEICDIKVTRRLHSGHERKMLCFDNPGEHVCEEAAEITLSCGHKRKRAIL